MRVRKVFWWDEKEFYEQLLALCLVVNKIFLRKIMYYVLHKNLAEKHSSTAFDWVR